MKQSDPLELLDEGTLPRPGPIGRILRLALGIACTHAAWEILTYHETLIPTPIDALPNIAVMILVAFCVFNYVVNIGFGRDWKRWPLVVVTATIVLVAAGAWLFFGTANHWLPGLALWLWMVYFFLHLGASFLLAAILATPGCEMRAIPELFGKMRGNSVSEHACPATFITRIDEWEREKFPGG